MKKNILLLATLLLLCSVSFGQTLYRTYYDYEKQHVHEEYYANSYGVKNGTYKEYSEYGGVLQEGTYKDDKKVGKWITRTEQGKLDKIENYKDDKLNGPWTSYYYDDGAKYKDGNFTDNTPIGNWYKYPRVKNIWFATYEPNGNDYFRIQKDWDNVPKSAFVGSEYVKVLKHYGSSSSAENADPNQSEDDYWGDYGHIINTYYPSGKKFQEGRYIDNQHIQGWVGDFCMYYPNGKLQEFAENDTISGKTVFIKEWSWPGGNKDSIQFYKKAEIAKGHGQDSFQQVANKQQEAEQLRQDSLSNIERSKQEKAQHIQDSVANMNEQRQEILQHKKDSITNMEQQMGVLYAKFKGVYTGSKQSMFLVNPRTHQPIVEVTYPNGKHLFLRSDTLIKFMQTNFLAATDVNIQLNEGKEIVAILDKLISLSGTDTKDLDKQMKKAETMDDIKRILGF